MKIFSGIGLFVAFCSCFLSTNAQYKSSGIPFVTNFSPLEYKAGNQNWAITQDSRGIMYFGNSEGLLEFDGTAWKIIDPVNAICFEKDSKGTIYVGGRNDFGYLAPDSLGNIKFFSLTNLLPEDKRTVDHIWDLACIDGKVYFNSNTEKIYVYENGKINIIELSGYLGCIKEYTNKIFIELSEGLCIFENNHPVSIKGGALVSELNIRNMFDFGDDTLLIVTRSNGMFIYHQNEITPWETEITPYIKDYQVYMATQLLNDYIAFGTVESGVIIMNKKGEPIQHINRYGGMINDDHCSIFCDRQGNVWSGLEYGISYLHVNSSWSMYNELAGLPTASYFSITAHNNRMYTGNAQGLYSKTWTSKENPLSANWKFINQPGIEARKVWSMASVDNDLLFSSSNDGTYCLSSGSLYQSAQQFAPFEFQSTQSKKHIIGAGEHGGIYIFKKKSNRWAVVSDFMEVGYIVNLVEDQEEHFWATEDGNRIVEFKLQADSVVLINRYDSTNGLPGNGLISVFKLYQRIFVGTPNGTYYFNQKAKQFEPCDEINSTTGPDVFILSVKEDNKGRPWLWGSINESELTGYFDKKANRKYICRLIIEPLNKINQFSNNSFYPIDDHNMLIGSSNCLVHLDPLSASIKPVFDALIRNVTLTNGEDTSIFNGTFLDQTQQMILKQDPQEKVIIPYLMNSLKICFSCNYYEEYQRNTYSYKMEGFDADWSLWTSKNEKEYTNLPEGDYCFMVKAKNLYGSETVPATYRFTITPPWYRTYLAYFCYAIFLILFIYVIVKLSIRKIELEKIKLEKIVQQRTEEVVRQKDEISIQNTKLEQQKEEILSQNEILSQQNEEITSQRDEIEAQRDVVINQKLQIERIHKGVTDSINYAKKIQEAMLPDKDVSRSVLGEHFVLYKPKDIVSGDFYWTTKVNDFLIVTVADCTGHGVPGAFMSMLGISFLNEIVRKQEVTSANQVLNHLRTEIVNALQQKGIQGEQKDGMDISLCAINTKTGLCQWAGANNPLYIIKAAVAAAAAAVGSDYQLYEFKGDLSSGSSMLIELKGDSMPVSIHPVMKSFTNHEISIETGDILYLMSDGFSDQFGGPQSKKYYTKHLKSLLVSIAGKSMEEQKLILEQTFEEWKGDRDQIDDVTILGIRYNSEKL